MILAADLIAATGAGLTRVDLVRHVEGSDSRDLEPRFLRVRGGAIVVIADGAELPIPEEQLDGDLIVSGITAIVIAGSVFTSCLVGY